ncbi:MAG: hypothetical protein ACFFC0_02305 [Promethearchaeota archaeon]
MELSSLSDRNTQLWTVESPVNLTLVCAIVGALAIFAPFYVWINPGPNMVAILAMTWRFDRVGARIHWMIMDPIHTIAPLPFTVWRLVFVYQMVRYYQGRGTRRRTVILGIFAELPFLIIDFTWRTLSPPTTILWDPGLTFPTPLMLLAASVFMWITPFPVPKTPFDDQPEPDQWWREETDSLAGQPAEPRIEYDRTHVESRFKCPRCSSEEIRREMHPGSFGIRARFVYSCGKCGGQWEG